MQRYFAPNSLIAISDATWILAELPDYSEADSENMHDGDRLDDAVALARATQKLRLWLCDGTLTAYGRDSEGKKTAIPEWIWADDKACLADHISDPRFRDIWLFQHRGVMLGSNRTPVFLEEKKLNAIIRGDIKSEGNKSTRGKGRPKGSGSFDDERWLDEMKKLVNDGTSPWEAAQFIGAEYSKKIQRKENVSDENVAQRLYKKYKSSSRFK